ncbi:dTDP-glucose 4,6-dehydratase [Sporosarcina sp. ANT_H38]|uniref:dTDP-glucose 4,6-dehydratase n=1 Tax=Sporosarcina sp. ANT_H38 TaxID=2597358 RepID=UPI0011F1921E|nr:dTDP-glucose 4,6-dehydratase [Sporosarcina sp. ANT_H38]KAA0944210.1 dTDP-glucose 4,6-dehydratase [Sporosarcina sp. ANT_H38]
MNILVTGGAGFIGSNFVRHMLSTYNYTIINLDLLTYAGNLSNLEDIEQCPNYRFVKGDICDAQLVEALFEQFSFQAVINFAAESHVDRSIADPALFLKTNVLGTQTLLEEAKKHWQGNPTDEQCRKFIQISTDEVYGTLGKSGYFTEQTNLSPNSPYSASKASGDLIARAYYETYGLPVMITRCSNNYGPYQFPEKLIPLMIDRTLQAKPLPLYGDGKQVRDWLHVKDHCLAIDTVLHKGKIGEVYNIGGNNEKENLEIVKLILSALRTSENLIEFVEDRLGHDRRYAIDNTKIRTELGWAPLYTFELGLDKTVEWYLSNTDWTKQVKCRGEII